MTDKVKEYAQRTALSAIPRRHLQHIFGGTMRYTWRGVLCNKSPFDLALYQLLIWQQKPRTIIEFGTKEGGSALWFYDLCRTFCLDTKIVSIDIQPHPKRAQVAGINFLTGNALAPEKVLPDAFMRTLARPLLVIDDSAHVPETVLSILRFMDHYLHVGEYIVIEDGILQSLEIAEQFKGGPSPAISQFLAERGESYAIDTYFCDFFGTNVTFNPNGYLKRVAL